MAVGKRIFLKRNLPSKEQIKAFEQIPAANIADVMQRNCAFNPRIQLVSKPKKPITAGPAFTVKTHGGDNLAIHAAMNYIGEGDVLVISNEEDTNRSLMGAIMFNYLRITKKIAGVVIDGPIRDYDEISQFDIPVYCTGRTPGGPYKEGPGEVNVPISCGGISVNPGDIIVMDSDGAIVIPLRDADAILPEAQAYQVNDSTKLKKTLEGTSNRDWVGKLLDAKGFEVIDDKYDA